MRVAPESRAASASFADRRTAKLSIAFALVAAEELALLLEVLGLLASRHEVLGGVLDLQDLDLEGQLLAGQRVVQIEHDLALLLVCLLYTSPSPRDS